MLIRKLATVSKTDGKKVLLTLEDDQELHLSREDIGVISEGENFIITIMPESEASLERDALARTLLNQILQHESHSAEIEN